MTCHSCRQNAPPEILASLDACNQITASHAPLGNAWLPVLIRLHMSLISFSVDRGGTYSTPGPVFGTRNGFSVVRVHSAAAHDGFSAAPVHPSAAHDGFSAAPVHPSALQAPSPRLPGESIPPRYSSPPARDLDLV